MTIGIYKIQTPSGTYIGQSRNVEQRWVSHERELSLGTHHCYRLQAAWRKHGRAEFAFVLIERCHADDLTLREQYYMDTTPQLLNTLRFARASIPNSEPECAYLAGVNDADYWHQKRQALANAKISKPGKKGMQVASIFSGFTF